MAKRKNGQNVNVNGTAVHSDEITVGANLSVPIGNTDKQTIRMIVSNVGNKDVLVKLQAADVDNDRKGIKIYKNTTVDVILAPNVYVGEVSAITKSGTTKLLTVVY